MDEIRFLLDVIEKLEFRRLPAACLRRNCRVKDVSSGRIGDGADFFNTN